MTLILFPFKLAFGIFKFSLGTGIGRFLTILAIVGILILNATTYPVGTGKYNHVISKHKEDGKLSLNCFDQLGTHLTVNEEDRRWIDFCKLPGGNIAVKVTILINGTKELITAYTLKGNYSDAQLIAIAEEEMGKYGFFSYVAEFLKPLVVSIFR